MGSFLRIKEKNKLIRKPTNQQKNHETIPINAVKHTVLFLQGKYRFSVGKMEVELPSGAKNGERCEK
jgi:hypothetical protein